MNFVKLLIKKNIKNKSNQPELTVKHHFRVMRLEQPNEKKLKQIMKLNSQSNTILINEIRKKSQLKKKRENESIGLTRQTHDPSHETRTTS